MKRWASLLVLLLAVAATAQDTPLPEYQVELIIVRHLNPSSGSELFPLQIEQEESELPVERFVPLDPAAYTLTPMAQKISRSRNFRVLSHSGWTQPGYGRDEARRKLLMRNTDTGELVSGNVVLIRERYLRLVMDLTVIIDGETYHLDTQRRMISRQVHYFDSPYFGVIAKITPL